MTHLNPTFLFGLAVCSSAFPAFAGAMDTEIPTASSAVHDLSIYPRFERPELLHSVTAVIDAASSCLAHGDTWKRPRSQRTDVAFFSAEQVDGVELETWSRTIEYSCEARPVTRCSYTYTWDEAGSGLSYASIECVGAHDDSDTRYSVTAASDASGAKAAPGKKGRRGVAAHTLTFFTNEFPGTMSWLHARVRRSDHTTLQAPTITQFDDFSDTDEAQIGLFSVEQMTEAMDGVRHLACQAVRLEGACTGAPATGGGPTP